MVTLKQLVALTIILMMVVVVLPAHAVAQDDQYSQVNRFHMNMKTNDELSPETQPLEENTIAQRPPKSYTNNGILLQRDWETVGTWTAPPLEYDLEVGNQVTFNMWFQNLEASDSADDSQTQFDWTLRLNGADIANAQSPSTDANDRREVRATATLSNTEFLAGDELSLYIEYWAFDEVEIYYDSPDNNSGFYMDGNSLIPIELNKKGGNVQLSLVDAFGTSLDDPVELQWIQLMIDGATLPSDGYQVETGTDDVMIFNTSVKPSMVSWPYSGGGKKDVQVLLSYYPHNESSGSGDIEVWDIIINVNMASGSDDDDPALGFGGALVAVAAVSIYLARRREK